MSAETKERFEQEERSYWQQRDELLKQYEGRWVAIVGGQVVAVGDSSGAVIREAYKKTGSTAGYVARVGSEQASYRIRRAAGGHFDRQYDPPMPKIIATVSHLTGTPTEEVDFVVDTGADLTVLRQAVGHSLGLWDSAWRTASVAGVGAAPEKRYLYAATVRLAEHDITVEVD